MDQNYKEKTLEKIAKSQNIIILAAKSGGFDALAASLALYLSLSKLGKNISVHAQIPTISDARRLYGVDKVSAQNQGNNFTIVVDGAVETVDKVTYFLDKNRLNIVIHPLPGSSGVQKNQISFESTSAPSEVLFLIGFDNSSQLNQEYPHEQFFNSETWRIGVSNSNSQEKIAQLMVANQNSSLSELTALLMQELSLPLDEDIAFNLYKGIYEFTGNFSPASTAPATFQIAAWLVKFGAGKASLAAKKFEEEENFPKKNNLTPLEQVEVEKGPADLEPEEDWFKPPRIYKGSKSVDTKY